MLPLDEASDASHATKFQAHDPEADTASDSNLAQPQPQEWAHETRLHGDFVWPHDSCSDESCESASCSESASPEPSERPSSPSMALSDDEAAAEKREDAVTQLVATSKARAPDALHPKRCAPCLFWPRGACALSLACGYCHLPHAGLRPRCQLKGHRVT